MKWVFCESVSRGCDVWVCCVGEFYMGVYNGIVILRSVWDHGRGDVRVDYSDSMKHILFLYKL